MIIYEIIEECLLKMNIGETFDRKHISEEQQPLINELLASFNIAYRELTTEYFNVQKEEKIYFYENKYSLCNTSKAILYPISLKRNGIEVAFEIKTNKIIADFSGEATLTYAYLPSSFTSINEFIDETRITPSILSDATLSEYYFKKKMFDLAKIFDTRAKSKVFTSKTKGRERKVKRRSWSV